MATSQHWSRSEVEACVDDYLDMLTLELNGQSFRKKDHLEALTPKLDNRTAKAVKRKHHNISAVLLELNYPQLPGYRPLGHYQGILREVVEERATKNEALQAAAQAAATRPAVVPELALNDQIWESAPRPTGPPRPQANNFSPSHRDYLAQEARNRSLGRAGELLVVGIEKKRLLEAGQSELSSRVEHVAATQGDGLGYDVLSYEEDGGERMIEVKTTSFGKLTPFYVTQNELARSEVDSAQFYLYRIFNFRKLPRLFSFSGTITSHCHLDPATYIARVG